MYIFHSLRGIAGPLSMGIAVASLSACATLGTFNETDADGDGMISSREASESSELSSLFNSADDNKDGALDEDEYELALKVIKGSRRSEKRRKTMTEQGGIERR